MTGSLILLGLGEWSSIIGTEEIPVVILSVGFSRVHDGNLFLGASEWHVGWVVVSIEVPGIRDHEIKN